MKPNFFWRDIPGLLAGYARGARKFREKKVCVHFFWTLPFNCCAIAVTAGAIWKEETSLAGERQFGRHFKRRFG